MRLLVLIPLCLFGCASRSVTSNIKAQNNDVFILSHLLHEHFVKNHTRGVAVEHLAQTDSLNRISNSFESINIVPKGGHISVYYKFSKSRSAEGIQLSDEETVSLLYSRWKKKKLKNGYDGEIQLDYRERSYRVLKIKLAN